jgi:hypothetical protein
LPLIIFVGSIASGKTSMARMLKRILASRGFIAKYVDININHGFAYLLTRIITSLIRYKYVGNYYLTIRFNNESFFCKYLYLMQLLDLLYIPIKYLISLKTFILFNKFRRHQYVILIDEYYLNSIVDYLYFRKKLCKLGHDRERICKIFYDLAFRVVLLSLKKDKTFIICMNRTFNESISGWILREKTLLIDVNHIVFRGLATKIILKILKQCVGSNVSFKSYIVQDFKNISKSIIEDILEFISRSFEAPNIIYRP